MQKYIQHIMMENMLLLKDWLVLWKIKRLGETENVVSWKSKSLSIEELITPTTTDNSLSPSIK